jgi:hypothetical protein
MLSPRAFLFSALLVGLLALTAGSARAQTSGANTTHDPSRIVAGVDVGALGGVTISLFLIGLYFSAKAEAT